MWYKMQFSAKGMHGAGKILRCKLRKRPSQAIFPGLAVWLPLNGRILWLTTEYSCWVCWRCPKLYAKALPHSQCTAWKAHLPVFVLLMFPIFRLFQEVLLSFSCLSVSTAPGKPGCPLSPPLTSTDFLPWGMQGGLITSAQGRVLKAYIHFFQSPPTWAWEHIFLFSLFLANKEPDVSKCWKCFHQVTCHKVSTQE